MPGTGCVWLLCVLLVGSCWACWKTNDGTEVSHASREPDPNAREFIFQTDPIPLDKFEHPKYFSYGSQNSDKSSGFLPSFWGS